MKSLKLLVENNYISLSISHKCKLSSCLNRINKGSEKLLLWFLRDRTTNPNNQISLPSTWQITIPKRFQCCADVWVSILTCSKSPSFWSRRASINYSPYFKVFNSCRCKFSFSSHFNVSNHSSVSFLNLKLFAGVSVKNTYCVININSYCYKNISRRWKAYCLDSFL